MAKSEIDDFFSENPILGISDVDDLKSCLSIIRELQVKFKKSMFEVKLDMGEDEFVAMCAMCPFYKELLNQASDYIIQANERVKVLREGREKKADGLAEKIRLAEITRVNEIRLAGIAEKQILENKADEREKKADDLAEKIRLAEIAEKQRLEYKADEKEKKADDLTEKIRLEEIIRAEKLRKEDLKIAEKVRMECREIDEKVREKLEEKEDAEKVAAVWTPIRVVKLLRCKIVGFMLTRHFPKLRRD